MIPDVDNDSIVYLNGQYVRLGDAKVSVLDRGFVFGDGIYEVVPVYAGKPFRMAHHIARLQRSLKAISIQVGFTDDQWADLFLDMVARTAPAMAGVSENVMIYLQVTRGVAKRDHAFPAHATPTVFCMVSPFKRPGAGQREKGLSTISIPDVRWLHCHIKSVSLLGNVLAKQAAVEAGVDEVVQFRDGYLSEGASTNIWVVRNGMLLAPEPNHLILEGVRYRFIEGLAQKAGIPFEARPVSRTEVDTADELMLSSATKEVLPIVLHDGRPVGSGRPGPVYAALRAAYDHVLEAL
ncbi:D-amino acid aminotransferase [Pusillimonas minor]|uniref:D-amino acid aminotransferase n=1 Tax=Pusillimonas minor TaxID=2697024 RepID=A0A842HMU8_9BURK|nr:D-amino acid aminotransferase [Pusillimonas minor]MBC2768898.1 D-amino acid aminotransferase [Pusillimonas minor]